MENGVPHVRLHLFDSAYHHPVDDLDISGLSITDFKRKFLKDIVPSGDQELMLSLYLAGKGLKQGR